MSLPSDNEDIKKEEEFLSNQDSSSDDSKDVGQDGKKKKRRSKELPKPAGHLEDEKIGPGTSSNSKTGRNEDESNEAGCSKDNADSNSGDKNVGEVREDIEQLKLNEGKAKPSKEPTKQQQTSPGIYLLPEQEPQPSGAKTSTENVQLIPENVTETNTDEPDVKESEEEVVSLPPSDFEINENAPPNTLNTGEMSQDPGTSYSPSKAGFKRTSFAQNTENTLDDISEITTDSSELRTDSSSGLQAESSSAQQDTMPLDETGNSSVSEYKTVESVMQDENSESEDCSNEAVPNAEGGYMDDEGGSDMEGVEAAGAVGLDPPSLDDQNVSVAEPEREDNLGELVAGEEMDDPRHDPDNLGAQGGFDYEQGGNEQISDQDGSNRQEGSSEQDSSDNQNLVARLIAENRNDSSTNSTPDSGICNSNSLFVRDDIPYVMAPYEVPEALREDSETNSSMGTSEMAGLNNLQGWIGAGENVPQPVPLAAPIQPVPLAAPIQPVPLAAPIQPVPLAAPIQPVPLAAPIQPVPLAAPNQPVSPTEGLGLNAPIDQSLPSTSSGNQPNCPGPNTVYLAKSQLLNIPMECAEHFESPNFNGREVATQQPGEGLETRPASMNIESRSNEVMESALGQRSNPSKSVPKREGIPDDVAHGNQGDEDSSKKDLSPKVLNPKTGQNIVRDESEQLSGESLEHSRESSLADMDDAIESSEHSKSEGIVQIPGDSKALRSDERPLLVGPKSTRSSSRSDERPLLVGPKQVEKKPSQKRLAKKNPEKKLKKKRKGNIGSCRQQAHLSADAKMETSSSEEDPNPEKEIPMESTWL